MSFQYKSDDIRYKKIQQALSELKGGNTDWTEDELVNADDLTLVTASKDSSGAIDVSYAEMWNYYCLKALFQKPEYAKLSKNPLQAVKKFFDERFTKIASDLGLDIDSYDIIPTDYEGELILRVEMSKVAEEKKEIEEVLAEAADFYSGRQGSSPMASSKPLPDQQLQQTPQGQQVMAPVRSDNKFNQVYITKEKPQDPKLVDRYLKTVFEDKFNRKYSLSTDVGDWHPTKTMATAEGKFYVLWEHDKTNRVKIATTFFPHETNKIIVSVTDPTGKSLIDTYFEIYRIPTDAFLVERFIRKVYFSIMKKFINSQVIKLYPFRYSFVFWKSNNPYFSYSFSEPKKNQIILDLIGFIKTSQKPILDDFFEQNNLRHKQGYLQTLLDAAEDAGIFQFHRHGNEVIIHKGVNFKAFLEGRIRKA